MIVVSVTTAGPEPDRTARARICGRTGTERTEPAGAGSGKRTGTAGDLEEKMNRQPIFALYSAAPGHEAR